MIEDFFPWFFPTIKKSKIKVEEQNVEPFFNSFVCINTKVVYKKPDDKTTAEVKNETSTNKAVTDANASKIIDNIQNDMNRMFDDIKKTFGPDFPNKKP